MSNGTQPQKLTFPADQSFQRELRTRVDAYFATNHLARGANVAMWLKSAFWMTFAWGSLMTAGLAPLPVPATIAMWMLAGFGFAAVGFNVAHDGTHGATSSNGTINQLAAWTFDLMGVSSSNWRIAHNLLHHTYTNVPGIDTDLEPGAVLRFQPFAKQHPWHRYQAYFAWFLYGFTGIIWIYKKDYVQGFRRHPRTGAKKTARDWTQILVGKALHTALFLGVPLAFGPHPVGVVLLGYLGLMVTAGFSLAIVFQLAHVVEGVRFPRPDDSGALEHSWYEHEMLTTANFGKSRLTTFITGGLDHQIEHHLFPTICHIHYPALAPIVQACAREHGLPYLHSGSFLQAVASHARMLDRLGRGQEVESLAPAIQTTSPVAAAA